MTHCFCWWLCASRLTWAAQLRAHPIFRCVSSSRGTSVPPGICWCPCVLVRLSRLHCAQPSCTQPASISPEQLRAGGGKSFTLASFAFVGEFTPRQRENIYFSLFRSLFACVSSTGQWGSAGIKGFFQVVPLLLHGRWTTFTLAHSVRTCAMVTELAWVAPTVLVTLATLDRTALCLTPPTLTFSRRTLKVDQWQFYPAKHTLTIFR